MSVYPEEWAEVAAKAKPAEVERVCKWCGEPWRGNHFVWLLDPATASADHRPPEGAERTNCCGHDFDPRYENPVCAR